MVAIYARKCALGKVASEEAQAFVAEHHRQGAVRVDASLKCVGLYHQGELVMVAQFCAPRTARRSREYTLELLRLCSKKNHRIVGGASRLLMYFIQEYKPYDFFTYQDTTGEAGKVYEHAGMTLVKEDRQKTYLVAPGKTMATGSRKEVLGLAYATRYGPDRILGTKLGEVFHGEGKRKSNRELFLQDLGWHVKEAHASLETCAVHGHWGSGKNQYQNWARKHASTLVKEVLYTTSRRAHAFAREEELIGDKWKTDPHCLNAMPGGVHRPSVSFQDLYTLATCEVHGESKHLRGQCFKCLGGGSMGRGSCEKHGEAPFIGTKCQKCLGETFTTREVCPLHGEVNFQWGACTLCRSGKSWGKKECPLHGLVPFHGKQCSHCLRESTDEVKACAVHGLTPHRGESCFKCVTAKTVGEDFCPTHGYTKFKGLTCYKCSLSKMWTVEVCSLHGEVKHRAGKCCKCSSRLRTTQGICEVHGEATFQWGKCCKCRSGVKAVESSQANGGRSGKG